MERDRRVANHRDAFDEAWEKANKKIDRGTNFIFVFAFVFGIAITVAIVVGAYLALKNWG